MIQSEVWMQLPSENIKGITWREAYFAVKRDSYDRIADLEANNKRLERELAEARETINDQDINVSFHQKQCRVLREALTSAEITDSDIAAAYEAAFTLSGSPAHSRAMHILIQAFPPLRWHGIVRRIKEALAATEKQE